MSKQNDSPKKAGDTVEILIDGKSITANEGQSLLDAAQIAGIYVPRLCYREGLPAGGHCRICTVKVNGRPASACTFPASEGLVVENNTDELNAMRKNVIEMLFVEGNHVCPSCEASGNCKLQALGYRFGLDAPHHPYLNRTRELDATHADVLIDRNRCILCGTCARASREIDGKSVFGFEGRGTDTRIAVNAANGLVGTDIEATDEAVAACPTGCLVKKRQGHRIPVGERTYDKTPIGADIEALAKAKE